MPDHPGDASAVRVPRWDDRSDSVHLERRVGIGIALLVPTYALIALSAMFSDEGPASGAAVVVCAVVMVSTVPVGAWWWFRSADRARMPGWFVLYADVGVAVALFTFSSRDLALNATLLFAVIGTYIAYFSGRRTLQLHSVFVNVVIVGFAVLTYLDGYHDALSVVTRTFVAVLVVNSVLAFRAVIKGQLALANTDSLTGLLNRRGFEMRLERTVASLSPDDRIALLVVDLDSFKSVNDTHGHAMGDSVLRLVAARLNNPARSSTVFVARSGGEEFTMAAVLDSIDIHTFAERIRSLSNNADDEVPVTVSVGAAMVTGATIGNSTSVEPNRVAINSAMRSADSAMYEAKRAGGNRVEVYEEPSR